VKNPLELSVRELAACISDGGLRAETIVRACLDRIEAIENEVHAWRFIDPALALEQARRFDALPAVGRQVPLAGVPVGVKDLMDTQDMPTAYGSPAYEHHRPVRDAACVAAAREAGAIVLGKTVTTEFATFKPGPTVNLRALGRPVSHTPGGSSSGSAAAVAAGMVPVAFGTQTAASIVRPAAFCGIVGYKPTHGTLSYAGIKSLATSLDTLGVFARRVDDAAFFACALGRGEPLAPAPAHVRIGVVRTPHWALADTDARQALESAAGLLEAAGATIADAGLDHFGASLTEAQAVIMNYKAAAAFAPERRACPEALSEPFRAILAAGLATDARTYRRMQRVAEAGRAAIGALFERFDALIAPSAAGEAPAGLESTGDPVFSRMWTLLGVPCVQVPVDYGHTGPPVGVTVIGPRWGDAMALSVGAMVERAAGPVQENRG
jgi:Asp-tRNA(Asn)/Glu-tRNA(Gln) amidotransferase A subunit family amidase